TDVRSRGRRGRAARLDPTRSPAADDGRPGALRVVIGSRDCVGGRFDFGCALRIHFRGDGWKVKEHVGCGCFPTGRHYPGIAHLLRIQARGVVSDLDGDQAWEELPIAVLDTETTGRDPASGDRIVEIGIVIGVRGEITKRLSWLIN